jgi:hypothetical protein
MNIDLEKERMMFILDKLSQVNACKGTGSAAKKIQLIKDCIVEGDDLIEFVLRTAFDPFWVTHISTIKMVGNDRPSTISFRELVGSLLKVKAVNNDLREEVSGYILSYPETYREMLGKLITKRINIGVDVKSINKALGKVLIQDVEIMKADSDIEIVKKWFETGEEVWAEMKYDGIRGFSEMVRGSVVSTKTYNMSEMDIDIMCNITEQLNKMGKTWMKTLNIDHFFFDFELTDAARQSISGEINKLLKGTAAKGCDEKWKANIFDVHTWDIFEGVKSEVSYNKRRYILEGIHKLTLRDGELKNILIAERWKVHNYEELLALFTLVLEQGCEGLVVKCGSGVYELKRSKNWVKCKAVKDCDLMIVSWFKGEQGTKREKSIGGFTCVSSDGGLVVSVGSGFKDKMLDEIMKNGPDSYIGKIAKIKYNMTITKSDSDIMSLFLPRFVEIRIDKAVANSIEEIKNI